MWLIRCFDETARSVFQRSMIRGTTHTYTDRKRSLSEPARR